MTVKLPPGDPLGEGVVSTSTWGMGYWEDPDDDELEGIDDADSDSPDNTVLDEEGIQLLTGSESTDNLSGEADLNF